jgi:hypothetical protein
VEKMKAGWREELFSLAIFVPLPELNWWWEREPQHNEELSRPRRITQIRKDHPKNPHPFKRDVLFFSFQT